MRDEGLLVFDPVFGLFSKVVQGADPDDPDEGPFFLVRMFDEGPDEVASHRGPAEGARESDDAFFDKLVGAIPVHHRGADPPEKVTERTLSGTGGVDDEQDRVEGEKDPEPPAVGILSSRLFCPLLVAANVGARLVGVSEGGLTASLDDPLVERLDEAGEMLETVGDLPLGQGKTLASQNP